MIDSKQMESVFNNELYWRVDWHENQPFVLFVGQQDHASSLKKNDEEKKKDDPLAKLEDEFRFVNTFGEQMENAHSTSVFLYNYVEEKLNKLDLQNERLFDKVDVTIAIFAQKEESLNMFVQGFQREAFRKGFAHCFNRESHIYSISLDLPKAEAKNETEDGPESKKKEEKKEAVPFLKPSKIENLTSDLFSSYVPFLHPSKKFILFASRPEKFVSHNTQFELMCLDLSSKSPKAYKLINTISRPNSAFVGLDHNIMLHSKRYFIDDGNFLLFCSQVQNSSYLFLIKTDQKSLENPKGNDNYSIFLIF